MNVNPVSSLIGETFGDWSVLQFVHGRICNAPSFFRVDMAYRGCNALADQHLHGTVNTRRFRGWNLDRAMFEPIKRRC